VRKRLLAALATAAAVAGVAPGVAEAHGLVQRQQLPIPQWLFAWAAAAVLVISFFALVVLWPQPRLEQHLFLRQRYAFFCGRHHPLFGRTGLAEGDLQSENFVSFTSDQIGGMLSPLTIFRDQQGFSGRIVASSSSLEEVRRLVIAGFGLGCLPVHVVAEDVKNGLLWRLPPDEGIADVDIHLLWHREQKMSRAERVFIESLLGRLASAADDAGSPGSSY